MKIEIVYACIGKQFKTFIILADPEIKCEEVLQIISTKLKDKYISLFSDRARIDNNKLIKDYFVKDAIFFASKTNEPPSEKYMEDFYKWKKGKLTDTNQGFPILSPRDSYFDSYRINTIYATYKDNGLQYKFYFTGGSKSDFFEGIEVNLKDEMNPMECRAKLESVLREKKLISKTSN